MADSEEKDTQNEKPKGNNFFVRLCYGVVERYKDTSKMSTPEVIDEFLKNRGYNSIKDFFDKIKDKKKNPSSSDVKPDSKLYETTRTKMLDDSRMNYTRTVTRERISAALDSADKKVAETTMRLFLDDSFGVGDRIFKNGDYFNPAFNKVCLSEKAFSQNDEINETGETVFHEIWHAIDNNYGVRSTNERDHLLSCSYILGTGSTFAETLAREWKSKIKIDELKAERNHEIAQYYISQGMDVAKIKETFETLSKKATDMYMETMRKTSYNSQAAENAKKRITNSPEYIQAEKAYRQISKAPVIIKRKWASLSDFISGATQDADSLGVGHSRKYWRENPNNRFTEAFAEIASSKSSNQASYSLLQKYLPETVSAFNELYDKLKSGEIKANGRKKYQA